MKIDFVLNGTAVDIDVRPDEMLLEALRRELNVRSVRATCGIGVCGACTALINGEPISTCIYMAPLAQGSEITTVEGLGGQHPVQQAFEETHAFQCGYCTPGMILTLSAFLDQNQRPSDGEIRDALGGNLCRCGCYIKIMDAARIAAGKIAPADATTPEGAARS
ncbi:MAG: (2Fe-2S)-binding protein [Chloroflexota bacterium]